MHAYSTRIPHFPENLNEYAPWVAKRGLLAPYGECQCGCGGVAAVAKRNDVRRGWQKGQPVPWLLNHLGKYPLEERFWAKVDKRGPDECWLWTGTHNIGKYGLIKDGPKFRIATRVGWELLFGPIPEGIFVCHKCDTPPCCNPDHWFLGTFQDNMDDRHAKGREQKGAERWAAKLTDDIVAEARELYARGGHSHSSLASLYGVCSVTMGKAIARKTWKHVP